MSDSADFDRWHLRGTEGCIHEDEPFYELERDAACDCPERNFDDEDERG